MQNSIRLLCLLAGAAVFGPLHAETSTSTDDGVESSWTITPAVTSQYLFRGVRVADTCFQPTVEYGRGPLTLGLWGSAALEDQKSGDSDPEIDLYGSYTFTVPNRNVEIVPGFALYTYPDAKRSNGLYSATFEPYVAMNMEAKGIRFTPKCYYDVVLKGATFELTAATAVPLKSIGTTLELSASIGTFRWNSVTANADPDQKNWGDYWSVGATLPYQITPNGQLALGVLYAEGHNNYFKQGTNAKVPNENAIGRAAVILSYSISL